MRTTTRNLAMAASAVLALAAAGGALAQVPPPPPAPPAPPAPPPPPPPFEAMGPGQHVFMMRGPQGDPAAHAQHLRDVLQLRPDQEGALKAYLEGSKPPARRDLIKDDRPDADDDKPMTTPERLDRQAARMAEMAAAFQKRADVTKAFYAALTPSQQKAFDILGPGPGGPRMAVRRIETRHDGPGMGAHRKVVIERKAG